MLKIRSNQFDCRFLPKSGRRTYGLDKFFSSAAKAVRTGLEVSILGVIAEVDVAYLDASFYANGEIPGRDMSGFPHPFITHSMERFAALPPEECARVRFIHLNHTNAALRPDSDARRTILQNGFRVAEEMERILL